MHVDISTPNVQELYVTLIRLLNWTEPEVWWMNELLKCRKLHFKKKKEREFRKVVQSMPDYLRVSKVLFYITRTTKGNL